MEEGRETVAQWVISNSPVRFSAYSPHSVPLAAILNPLIKLLLFPSGSVISEYTFDILSAKDGIDCFSPSSSLRT